MKRHHIIGALSFLAVVAVLAGVRQFYLQERLDKYRADEDRLKQLQDKEKALNKAFGGFKPELVVQAYSGQVDPWAQAVEEWAKFFVIDGNEVQIDLPTDASLKFWYEDEYKKRRDELFTYIMTKRVLVAPEIVNTLFGIRKADQLQGGTIDAAEIAYSLQRFELGSRMLKRLIEAKAVTISSVVIWPPKSDATMQYQYFGLDFTMYLEDLMKFMASVTDGDVRRADSGEHFSNVSELRIVSTSLMVPNPLLTVQMVLTQVRYVAPAKTPGGIGLAGPADRLTQMGSGLSLGLGKVPPRKATWWESFRKKYLPF